jgi:Acetyltransferase (GNAT) domain
MEPIIAPVSRVALEAELTPDRFVRVTNNGRNHVYVVDWRYAPDTVREIGRLREITFREAGGGTGLACDLDDYDTGDSPYQQLIVWSPDDREIVGGYRFIRCQHAWHADGRYRLSTADYFAFSDSFCAEVLPWTIELGRSFIQPAYQSSRQGLFSLDNLWDGLGALIVDCPDVKYFFGKVTLYRRFNAEARDLLLSFMRHYFPDPEHLVRPHVPEPLTHDLGDFAAELAGRSYQAGRLCLLRRLRALGEGIPPLFNAYMNLSATMRMFGTASNHEFGEAEETGIMITIADIRPSKLERHIASYRSRGVRAA